MIKSLRVEGLNSKMDFHQVFNPDINIFTGKNGSGKTTILKLIWYVNSGHLNYLISEINFAFIELISQNYQITISKKENPQVVTIKVNDLNPVNISADVRRFELRNPRTARLFNEFKKLSYPSLFFPTFRRIEGGFSMERVRSDFDGPFDSISIKEAMSDLSERLSTTNQKFVVSISTDDLIKLITTEYAKITDQFNTIQKQASDLIIQKIKQRTGNETSILESIQRDIEETENLRRDYFKPFEILSDLIRKIFQHKGVILQNLTIGDVGTAISSEKLSAGEKQMLSFLCYNTFSKSTSIFIDEPELSLHPDWQRTLIPTLLEQGNNNQFFIATHSPFIYSKYSDKEIMLSLDKGDN